LGNHASGIKQQFATGVIMGLLSTLGGLAGSFFGGGPIGGAIGSALGGVIEGDSGTSGNAANAANAGAQSSIDLQRRMYEENVARQQPFYQAGVNALPSYLQGIGQGGELVRGFTQADYQADPGYQFRLSEGQRALAHGATPGRGGLVSGNSLKAMQDYAQNSASAEYNNAYNRYRDTQGLRRNALAGVVGFAPTASSAMGAAGSNYAAGASPQMYQQGVNTGNAMIAGNQANQSAYGNLGNALGKYLNTGGGQYYNPTTNSGGFSGTSLANTFYSGTGGIGD